jgi:hypothetical protein
MGVRMEIGKLYAEAGNLAGENPEARANREALANQIAQLGNAENESWGVELGYRYDQSPIVCSEANPPPVSPIKYEPTTWPGARLPHVFLGDGASIHDKLGLYFTFLAVDKVDANPIERAAASVGIPLVVLQLSRPDLLPLYERPFLLIRPDQHVAWRGDKIPELFGAVLQRAVGRL